MSESATASSHEVGSKSIHDHGAVQAYDELVNSHRRSRIRRAERIKKLREEAADDSR